MAVLSHKQKQNGLRFLWLMQADWLPYRLMRVTSLPCTRHSGWWAVRHRRLRKRAEEGDVSMVTSIFCANPLARAVESLGRMN